MDTMPDSFQDGFPGSLPINDFSVGLSRILDNQSQPHQRSRPRVYGQEIPPTQSHFESTTSRALTPKPLQQEYDSLDEFDRQLLGLAPRSKADALPRESGRLSLPISQQPQRRILGDASHHFRPFATQPPSHRHSLVSVPSTVSASLDYVSRPSHATVRQAPDVKFQEATLWDTPRPETPSKCPPSLVSNPRSTARESWSFQSQDTSSPLPRTPAPSQQIRNQAPQQHSHYSWTDRGKSTSSRIGTDPPLISGTQLISPRQALPTNFHPIFRYELFNAVQSKVFPLVYGSNDNVVVSAPTGCGKTAILEMAICRLIGSPGGENFKIVCQAPTKSLCSERAKDWEAKFRHMNLKCVELTGDTSQSQARRVGDASIIVTTPEKWDSVTRKWSDHKKLLELVRLVLIDEVHILKDLRGATLEAVVSRMKTIGAQVRFVALSATVPNIQDIATWLGLNHANQLAPASFEAFGEELRPVQLEKFVYGFTGQGNNFIFDKTLQTKLPLMLARHSEKKPIMVFCFTRNSCESTARNLAEWWSTCSPENKAWPAPRHPVKIQAKDLEELMPSAVAYHHAGLDSQDRAAVEAGFRQGDLFVICCTSTLAVGVNLPCHTVVLKGTTGYSGNEVKEYSDLEVMQMLGRAGRPQYDNSAVGIIMTQKEHVGRYSAMVSGEQILESTLHLNLLEHLNSEVGLGTIKDCEAAQTWVSGTFLSVRMRQAPQHYGATGIRSAEDAEVRMQEWCQRDIGLLQEHGLITADTPFKCTEYGSAMARYMVRFDTMRLLQTIDCDAGIEGILTKLCRAEEFQEFRTKSQERAFFRMINNREYVRYPIKENLNETWHKVSLVIQFHLGGSEWPNGNGMVSLKRQLATEKLLIFDRLNRLVRCLIDCRAADGDGAGTYSAFELVRSLNAGSWDGLPCQLAQIPGFGPVAVRKWNSHGVRTVSAIADMDFQQIERLASRNPPYGRDLLKRLANFPRLQLEATLNEPKTNQMQQEVIAVTIDVHLQHNTPNKSPSWNGKIPAVSLLVMISDGRLADVWRGNISKIDHHEGLRLKLSAALQRPNQQITCSFSCEEIVGTEVLVTLESHLPPSAFKHPAPPLAPQKLNYTVSKHSDSYFDEVEDEDLVAVMETPLSTHDKKSKIVENACKEQGQVDLHTSDAGSQIQQVREIYEPKKMPNGKWMCNHACRNNGLTKSGKPCSHKCCKEGLDQPRAPPQAKKVKEVSKNWGRNTTEPGSQYVNDANTGSIDCPPSSTPKTVVTEQLDRKRPSETQEKLPKSKVLRTDYKSDFELVDLSVLPQSEPCGVTRDEARKVPTSAERGRKIISELHSKVSGAASIVPRLTKSYRVGQPIRTAIYDTNASTTQSRRADKTLKGHVTGDVSESDDGDFPDIEDILKESTKSQVVASEMDTDHPNRAFSNTLDPDYAEEERLNQSSRSSSIIIEDARALETALESSYDASPVTLGSAQQLVYSTPRDSKPSTTNNDSSLFFEDPFEVGVHSDIVMEPPANPEPAWVATMDPSLIDALRDVVNFVN